MKATWDFACPDWADRLQRGESLMPSLPLFESEAADAVAFFDGLRLPDVLGEPLLRDACRDWFRDIVRAVFGSRDPKTNIRYVREVFALVGKGNSKTTYSGALMIVALLMNVRKRVEFHFLAPVQATAEVAFDAAKGMIDIDPELSKRFHCNNNKKEIFDRLNKAKLKVKTFDLNVMTGPKPAGVLIDEIHALGKSPHTAKVLRQIRGGLEKNTDGFLIFITTQSDERPAGAFKAELKTARAIRDGKLQGRVLPILYEFPEAIAKDEKFWSDPKVWHMVMPNLGASLQLDSLIEDFQTESTKGEEQKRLWASQHLNIEIGLGLHSDRWAGADHWEDAVEPNLDLDEILRRSEVVTMGADGGGLDDLLAVTVLGRCRETRRWLHWGRAWAHPSVLKQREDIAPRLHDFAADGDVSLVQAIGQDVEELKQLFEKVNGSGLLFKLGVDPAGVGAIVDAANQAGIEPERVVGISQGWKLSGAIKTAERALAEGTMVHCDQPAMAWNVDNAKAVAAGNAITINKQNAGSAKIDMLVATFDAVAVMSMNPRAMGSIYDDPAACEEAFGAAPAAEADEDDDRWDAAILADPDHPMFAEHKRRFETWQELQD